MVKEELYSYDRELRSGLGVFCGVDEAGRGPLAGPVCCAAVILHPESRFDWLDDSKKVTALRREALFEQIEKEAEGLRRCGRRREPCSRHRRQMHQRHQGRCAFRVHRCSFHTRKGHQGPVHG